MLTGIVSNIAMDKNDPTKVNAYGNFDLTDETGTVYVYGLTIAPAAKNDKTFEKIGIKNGDKVTLIGTRTSYNGTVQVGGPAYYISHETPAEGGDDNTGNEEEAGQYASNVTFTTVESTYTDGLATVNGVADVATLKFGTSKKYGEAKITLPKGTKKLSYYAVAWKGNPSKLQFSVGDTVLGAQEVAANDGATGNAPYTLTVADTDHYTLTLSAALEADTEVTVKTVETGFRAIMFNVVAE